MKIKTLKDMGFDGKHTPSGTIVECPKTLANELIATNRAVAVEDDAPAEVETQTEGPKPFPEGDDEGNEGDGKPADAKSGKANSKAK